MTDIYQIFSLTPCQRALAAGSGVLAARRAGFHGPPTAGRNPQSLANRSESKSRNESITINPLLDFVGSRKKQSTITTMSSRSSQVQLLACCSISIFGCEFADHRAIGNDLSCESNLEAFAPFSCFPPCPVCIAAARWIPIEPPNPPEMLRDVRFK